VTSRPELPIRLGFKKMAGGTYQDFILHEVSKATIEHDISIFFEHKLAKIREERSLPLDWPGDKHLHTLVEMAVPLFIFAATVCRFVGETKGNARRRLGTILDYQPVDQVFKLDRMYLPILNHLFDGQDEAESERLAQEFREVVGAIVVLANPLSVVSLASLLGIPEDEISCRLDSLHSVLSIPPRQDSPIRLLHLSFRDFLVDSHNRGKSFFWIDEKEMHQRIASKCLELMSRSNHLKKNIYNLQAPGALQIDIDSQTKEDCLPAAIRYACRYWVYHLEQGVCHIRDGDQVHIFLQEHLLHWLEALGLMGNASEGITMIRTLQSLLEVL